MVPAGYQSGTFWVPTESVTAFTLSHPSPGYSPVWTLTSLKNNNVCLNFFRF